MAGVLRGQVTGFVASCRAMTADCGSGGRWFESTQLYRVFAQNRCDGPCCRCGTRCFLEKVYVALQATCSSHHFHRADFHTRNILCACGAGTKRCADGKNQRLPDHNPVPERSCERRQRPAPPCFSNHEISELGRFFGQRRMAGARTRGNSKGASGSPTSWYLGCSAGTLSRRDTQGLESRCDGQAHLALHVISRSARWRGRNARSPSPPGCLRYRLKTGWRFEAVHDSSF